jgi:hypothetical protein
MSSLPPATWDRIHERLAAKPVHPVLSKWRHVMAMRRRDRRVFPPGKHRFRTYSRREVEIDRLVENTISTWSNAPTNRWQTDAACEVLVTDLVCATSGVAYSAWEECVVRQRVSAVSQYVWVRTRSGNELLVRTSRLRTPRPTYAAFPGLVPAVGDTVEGHWEDRSWFQARVLSVLPDHTHIEVRWIYDDDDDESSNKPLLLDRVNVRPIRAPSPSSK